MIAVRQEEPNMHEPMGNLQRFIFILSGSPGLEAEGWLSYLQTAGVAVDRAYGAVSLDAEKTRFVLRGRASKEVVEKLMRNGRLEILADPEVER